MKKLNEYIEELPAGQKVRIGSGSGFFYIGKVNSDIIEELLYISYQYLCQYEKMLEKSQYQLDHIDEIYVRRTDRQLKIEENKKLKRKKYKQPHEVVKMMDIKKKNEIRRLTKLIPKYQDYIDKWTHLTDRYIKEVYPSFMDKNVIIIVVEGMEHGKYWYEGDKGEGSEQNEIYNNRS